MFHVEHSTRCKKTGFLGPNGGPTPNVKQKKHKHKMRVNCGSCSGAKVKTFSQKSTKKYLKKFLPNGLLWTRLSPCKTKLR